MSRVYGVVTGTVKDVKDPDSQGRVLVAFPWLPGENDSYWAPVATLMSGSSRGSWFMPEVDDEVLVAFEHGNVDQPYVIGYLWNGVQKPPDGGGESVRRIKTVSGHVLEFHDEDGAHKVLIETAGQQQIALDDTSQSITIQTQSGEVVKLSPGQIEAQAATGTVSIDATTVSVTAIDSVAVSCTSASVTAGGALALTAPQVAVNAPVTTFAGVLVAQTVVANAIVSAAYTPAPGNTFGL